VSIVISFKGNQKVLCHSNVKTTSIRRQTDKFVEIGSIFTHGFCQFRPKLDFFDLRFDIELTSIRPTISHWVVRMRIHLDRMRPSLLISALSPVRFKGPSIILQHVLCSLKNWWSHFYCPCSFYTVRCSSLTKWRDSGARPIIQTNSRATKVRQSAVGR